MKAMKIEIEVIGNAHLCYYLVSNSRYQSGTFSPNTLILTLIDHLISEVIINENQR